MIDYHDIPVSLRAPDYRRAFLTRPLEVEWIDRNGDTRHLIVPGSFYTDFASVPRPLWAILPPIGPWLPAALAHDYAYYCAPMSMTRADADHMFRAIMRAIYAKEGGNVGLFRLKTDNGRAARFAAAKRRVNACLNHLVPWAMWAGVRLGGWLAWNHHRKHRANEES